MLRTPAVAGQFYPGQPRELADTVNAYLAGDVQPEPALAVVCPHAGYIYSGATVGKVLARVQIPKRVVILGPNHRGLGGPVAVMSRGAWQTPLGEVALDQELGAEFITRCPLAEEDPLAHRFEHSLEVQVPFLQALRPDFKLTPIVIGGLRWDECQQAGKALAQTVKEIGEPVLLFSSTDMNHYESDELSRAKDQKAIERVLALDPRGLYQVVTGGNISMCGVLPTAIVLVAALELGAAEAVLVHYTNSGETTGDKRQVVGYAGLIIK